MGGKSLSNHLILYRAVSHGGQQEELLLPLFLNTGTQNLPDRLSQGGGLCLSEEGHLRSSEDKEKGHGYPWKYLSWLEVSVI